MSTPVPHIVILGGGVIGFTTGISLLEQQASKVVGSSTELQVTIVSRDLPRVIQPVAASSSTGSSASSKEPDYPASYASIWAGAHHVSDAKTPQEQRWDRHTFKRMAELEREKPWKEYYAEDSSAQPIMWVNQVETWQCWNGKGKPWDGIIDWYPNFRELAPEELPEGCALGCEFSTLDINVPLYLPWLRAQFESLGGQVVQENVGSIADAVDLATTRQSGNEPHRIIVAPGLGAAQLQEVQDPHMQPVRGQVLRISAPHCVAQEVKQCWQTSRNRKHKFTGFSRVCDKGFRDCYILPMGDGTFVVGGTRLPDDWDSAVRPQTSHEILTRALSFYPELASPSKVGKSGSARPQPEHVVVNTVGVGLRPARKTGPRVERGGKLAPSSLHESGAAVDIIYAYGFGGFGYQASWGVAQEVCDLNAAADKEAI